MSDQLKRVAAAIADERNRLRAENDKRLAKDGFWPDRHYQPPDIDLARAAINEMRVFRDSCQPVPGVYGPDRGAAVFVAKEVG